MRQIEEKLLLEDEFAERLSRAEDELIDDYLDGQLSAAEAEDFMRFFLITKERMQKFRLLKNLRKYAARSGAPKAEKSAVEKIGFWNWILSPVALRFAVAVLLIGTVGFGVWRVFLYESDVDKGLAQLKIAYQNGRPLEARTTLQKDYAPFSVTRGGDQFPADEKAKARAYRFLSDASENARHAGAHHALGLYYLNEKQFDKSLSEFNQAVNLAPETAAFESDLGALLLEMGKKARTEQNGAKSFEYLDQSLKHLDKAIALDPKLPEPRFNRAICLQILPAPEQAKQAWRDYLELDPTSKWADEARRNLQELEEKKTEDLSADRLERDFLTAFEQKNEPEARRLLSGSRELIREKYLPQRLAMSYLNAPETEKKTFLEALQYAGELEKKSINDDFAAEIAGFYSKLSPAETESLKRAQSLVRNGYKLCLDQKYQDALPEFEKAGELFGQTGNIWEAQLSAYFIAYVLINMEKTSRAVAQLNAVAEFSRERKYRWLTMTALYWVAGSFVKLQQPTRAKQTYQQALTLAEELADSYAIQRNLIEIARLYAFVGQKYASLNYLARALEESNRPETSLRQRYRNYGDAFSILAKAKLYNVAKPLALESVGIADKLDDKMFKVFSRNNAALAFTQTGNFREAQNWLDAGRENAELISDEKTRNKMVAYSLLSSGNVARETENYEESEIFYTQAGRLYADMEFPANLYESQKGRLLTYLALGKNAELESQIPAVLKLTEDYREKILDEQERTSFFDREQNIYDIAADFEFRRGRFEESYNFAETSNSRSLLDWLQKGVKIAGDKKRFEILLGENAIPLKLSEIRARMSAETQILQYTVLADKVLIWLVSKEKFTVVATEIKAGELNDLVENYLRALPNKNDLEQVNFFGQKLYNLLISPILSELDARQTICLIPHKILFFLPFAALVSEIGKPFLAEFNHFYAPSANIFLHCTENARAKTSVTDENLLSVGNPAFDGRLFYDLSDLPSAEKEAREIAALYNNPQILIGRQATKTAFQNAVKTADIVHFAGHYVVTQNAPLSSYLLLANDTGEPERSTLTNAELIGEKLPRAKLVILSACQTGVEHYYNGEGLIGLSRTFLAAGVPLVVASQWKVDTDATARLMNRFHYFRQREKLPTAAALRRAQLEMMNDATGRFRAPFYWAAFAVFGGSANF